MFKRVSFFSIFLVCALARCGEPRDTSCLLADRTDSLYCTEHRVFVTSTLTTGSFGSVAAGDAICANLALSAGLQRRYVAILSDASTAANVHVTINGPVYKFTDAVTKVLVANGSADFWDGTIATAIDTAENYTIPSAVGAWTGSTPAGGINTNCGSWTGVATGTRGGNSAVDSTWIQLLAGTPCGASMRLYCISQ
jgi:hypothetical protein